MKIHYYREFKKHEYEINWDIKRKTKTARKSLDNGTWEFSSTWTEPRPKMNRFDADFPFTAIGFCFYTWSKITDFSRKIASNILQHLYITSSTNPWRTTTAKTSWENSLFLLVLSSPFYFVRDFTRAFLFIYFLIFKSLLYFCCYIFL